MAKRESNMMKQTANQEAPDFFVSQRQLKLFTMCVFTDQAARGHANPHAQMLHVRSEAKH